MKKLLVGTLLFLSAQFARSDSVSLIQGISILTTGDAPGDYIGWRYARDSRWNRVSWGLSGGLISTTNFNPGHIGIFSGIGQEDYQGHGYVRSTAYRLELFLSYKPKLLGERLWGDLGIEVQQLEYDSWTYQIYAPDLSEEEVFSGPIQQSYRTQAGISALLGISLYEGEHLRFDWVSAINGMRVVGPTSYFSGIQIGLDW